MGPENRERSLEEQLDAALKAYGVAEPREGLEGRILATLKSERDRTAGRNWHWWPVLVAVASMLLIGAAVLLRTARSTGPLASGNQAKVPGLKQAPSVSGNMARALPTLRPRHRQNHAVPPSARRERFPSPQPLSEQELLLARYVEQFPRDAALMARAQTHVMKQEMLEQELPAENAAATESQQENP